MEKYANKKLQKENSRNYNAFSTFKRDRRGLAKAIKVVFTGDFNFCPF